MDNIKIGLVNIFVGFLIIILCIPLVKRKIKMNRWYGMRIPKSFKSEENWYKINEYGGRIFIYWSIPIVLIGIISLFLPPLGEKGITLLSLAPLLVILPAIQLLIYSRKI
ncbi:MAG: SdpI family protein [Candidatus Firestonebacteria bacterium]